MSRNGRTGSERVSVMDTPVAPERGACRTLYGGSEHSINRRGAIALAGLIAASVALPARAGTSETLTRAMTAAGGRDRLKRVKALKWTGTAHVILPGRKLELGVETRVEPFGPARSTTWIASEGKAAARTMTIDAAGGTATRDGKPGPLPAAIVVEERQQFGIYGYMLLAFAPATATDDYILRARRPGYPAADLEIDDRGRLVGADYAVTDSGTGQPVAERFSFSGMVTDQGIRWPKQIAIARGGKPYFDLTIDSFTVELA